MKKRFLSLLCILAFALPFIAATPCFAVTGNTEINQITYQYDTETGEAVVTGAASDISGDVEIPGTITVKGEEYAVTSIGDSAFYWCTGLTNVTIPEGVTSIGNYAFYICTSLTQITIPEGVTSIGDGAFFNCTRLTDVYVWEDLSLGTDSFIYVSQDVHVWRYKVLKSAEVSEDGKVHVAIVSVKDKDDAVITDSLEVTHDAMGDGYVIDEVGPDNLTLTHTLTETEATSATCTEPGNVEYWTCDACGKHFKDENGTTEIEESKWIIPATGHSYGDDGHCMACGAVDSDFAPAIIAGANATWHKGSEDGLSFTSNAAFADFLKVQVDGKDVDASNYTVKEGSTIVTLKPSYLETLSAGKHTLAIVSDTGTAETEFTVLAAEGEAADSKAANDGDKESLAETGDGSMLPIAALSILAMVSAAAGALSLRRIRL